MQSATEMHHVALEKGAGRDGVLHIVVAAARRVCRILVLLMHLLL